MPNIHRIVETATEFTNEALRRAPHLHPAALIGLERMRDSLKVGAPDHEALRKLESYLEELRRRFAS
jgi:hypothetical protein